jgi:hypothetical protein
MVSFTRELPANSGAVNELSHEMPILPILPILPRREKQEESPAVSYNTICTHYTIIKV